MGLFTQLCRNTGLMIHGIIQPLRDDRAGRRHHIKRTVDEAQVSPTMTLRRTTIEEIEVKQPRTGDKAQP